MAASARCLANQPRIKCDTFARCRRATGPCRTLEPRAQPFPVAADAGRLSGPDRRLQTCAVLLRFWPQPCCWLWASLPRRRALQPRPLLQRAWRQRQVRGGARAEAALCSYTPPPACGPSSSRCSRFGWFRHSPRHTLAPSGTLAALCVAVKFNQSTTRPAFSFPAAERELLLSFKAQITNWEEAAAARGLAGWCEDGAACISVCSWSGVECNLDGSGQVTEL